MKIILCLLILSLGTSSFAICEYEKERYERNKKSCEDWCEVTGWVSMGGTVVGVCFLGPLGGLCGAAGVVPGVVAKRICDLAQQKKQQWEQCETDYEAYLKNNEEAKKNALIEHQAKAFGIVAARNYFNVTARFKALHKKEVDDVLERHLDLGEDPHDPEIRAKIEKEVSEIDTKYAKYY